MSDRIIFDGVKYYWNGRYFQSHQDDGGNMLHRVIWAKAHGPIPEGFVVHHQDKDVRNNAIENLAIKPFKLHVREHKLEEWKVRESEPLMITRCEYCGVDFLVDSCHLYTRYCSPGCNNKAYHTIHKEHYTELARGYRKAKKALECH